MPIRLFLARNARLGRVTNLIALEIHTQRGAVAAPNFQ